MTNTNTDKYWKWAIIGLVIYNLIALCQYLPSCEREDHIPDVTKMVSEQARTATITTNTAEHAKYKALAEKQAAQIEALSGKLVAETGKRKQAEQKARESAAEYAKNRTLDNCDKALTDCQEESETKAYSLAVSERMIAGYESSDSLHRGEIERQVSVIDTLNRGWQKANVVNGKLEKKVKNRNTLLKIGAGIIAVLGVLVAAR